MISQSAYFLVYHGSRDPRPAQQAEQLAAHMADCLTDSALTAAPLAVAPLECCDTPLHERLTQFGHRVAAEGVQRVYVIPLFLLAGVHVRDDIPAEVEAAQQRLGDRLLLRLCPYLGSHPHLTDYLQSLFRAPADFADTEQSTSEFPYKPVRLLISHGSRRPGGNDVIEAIAHQIQARPAYWSVEPSLDSVLSELLNKWLGNLTQQSKSNAPAPEHSGTPAGRLEILPYFLFSGGITDAITQTVESYRQQWPQGQIWLAQPLGAKRAIALMAIDLVLLSQASSNSDVVKSSLSTASQCRS